MIQTVFARTLGVAEHNVRVVAPDVGGSFGLKIHTFGDEIAATAAAMWSVIGVLVALLQRRGSGNGCSIDTSLYESALGWMCYHAANFQASGELPKPQGSGAAMIVPYRGYASKDGFIVIAAGNDKLFAALARALGHACHRAFGNRFGRRKHRAN